MKARSTKSSTLDQIFRPIQKRSDEEYEELRLYYCMVKIRLMAELGSYDFDCRYHAFDDVFFLS